MKHLTQQQFILKLLQETPAGVNSYDLTYVHSIKQAPTRVKELKEQGYLITATRNKNQSVTYHLVGEVQTQASKAIVEPQIQAHDAENCQIDDHYHEYIKDNRKFWRHVEEARQEAFI